MKFRYEYRTSDNIRHSDVVAAKDREAVFALLAMRGIRPGRVEALPDPWRWLRLSAVLLSALAVAAAAVFVVGDRKSIAEPMTRRQLYGDPVLIEKGVAGDWNETLSNPTDRYLARYAQPGWRVRVRADGAERAAVAKDLASGRECKVRYADDDLMEFRQVKRIVAGMRREAGQFVRAGGNASRYLELLDERQQREGEIVADAESRFARSCADLPNERLFEVWAECNRRLKTMGLRPLPMPDKIAGENF